MGAEASGRTLQTSPPTPDLRAQRRARALRRFGLIALTALIGCAMAGLLGVRTRTVRAEAAGWRLAVTYGAVSRAGLATPWTVEVHRPDGLDGPVTIATTADYFDLFDENGLDPDPASATWEHGRIVWTFEAPETGPLVVDFDARIEPGAQAGRSARTAVLVDGRAVVEVGYRTRLMP